MSKAKTGVDVLEMLEAMGGIKQPSDGTASDRFKREMAESGQRPPSSADLAAIIERYVEGRLAEREDAIVKAVREAKG